MPDLDSLAFVKLGLSFDGLLAYFGLGPGPELIPYFVALLGFAGAALLAVVQWPLQALIRRFSRANRDADRNPKGNGELKGDEELKSKDLKNGALTVETKEAPGESDEA